MKSRDDEQRSRVEGLEKRVSRLTAAILRINASLELDTVLREVVESARALTGAPYGIIATVDDAEQPQDARHVRLHARGAAGAVRVARRPAALRALPAPRPRRCAVDLPAYVRSLWSQLGPGFCTSMTSAMPTVSLWVSTERPAPRYREHRHHNPSCAKLVEPEYGVGVPWTSITAFARRSPNRRGVRPAGRAIALDHRNPGRGPRPDRASCARQEAYGVYALRSGGCPVRQSWRSRIRG